MQRANQSLMAGGIRSIVTVDDHQLSGGKRERERHGEGSVTSADLHYLGGGRAHRPSDGARKSGVLVLPRTGEFLLVRYLGTAARDPSSCAM